MRKGRVSVLLFAALVFSLISFPAAGASSGFRPQLSKIEGRAGETVELSVPYDGSQGEVGAFAVEATYPPDLFTYVRVDTDPGIRDGYSLTEVEDGLVRSVYVMEQSEPLVRSDTFTYHFQIREDAEPGDTVFSVSVYQVLSLDSESLRGMEEHLTFSILLPPSNEAFLLSLIPDNGTLEPAFSPDRFEYTVTVPFSVTAMTFSAEPASGAICKVNRKNLGAGGSDTLFVITVTAEDGKTKAEYQITVHREEKAAAAQAEATPTPNKTASPQKTDSSTIRQTVSEQPNSTSAAAPTATPKTTAASTAKSTNGQKNGAETETAQTAARPSVTVRGGNSSVLPALLTVLGFVFACAVFRPLSHRLAKSGKSGGSETAGESENDEEH
ncbi:MAG: cadherin-like beta sandwich domain-containing protein [Acutalibacter sp.]|nr:cadherin-like beta sandwich domain-containing protein [Acutalibacter sp.]